MKSIRLKQSLFFSLLLLFFSSSVLSQVPRITGVSPLSGPVGTIVTLSGSNFAQDPQQNIVRFGTVRAQVLTASANTITVSVPAGASYAPLSVTTGKLTGVASSVFLLSFNGGYSFYDNSFPPVTDPLLASKEINSVITTDLDDDGRPDLIASVGKTAGALQLSIFRNTGTNRIVNFEKQDIILSTVQGIATELATGDFDGDGRQDLAIICSGAARMVVLRNTSTAGNISFDLPVEVPLRTAVSWIAIGDINMDGKPDIALADQFNIIFTYSNTTVGNTPGFARGPEFETGSVPVGMQIADMDQDGQPDIITGSGAERGVCVHRNNSADGIISIQQRYSRGTDEIPFAISVGDYESDGKLDIAASLPSANMVAAIRNTSTPGHIQLGGPGKYPSSDQPKGIAITDMNGDGQADIVTVNSGFRNISVIRNNTRSAGYFAFDMHQSYQVSISNPVTLAIADYNGDGQPDIATGSSGNVQIKLFRNATSEPTVKSFTPAVATMDETVTITGTNFFDINKVSFGNIDAKSFIVESATSIKAVVASGSTGSVQVQNTHGSSSLVGFTYSGLPVISSFTPASSERNRPVVITGKNFTGVRTVKFGNTDALSFTVNSVTTITARPAENSSGSVTVTTDYGTATKDGFTYIKTPVITDNAPYRAKAGATITIRGANFSDKIEDNIVQFGSLKGVVTAASSTAISATVPDAAPYAPVTVTSKQHTIYSKHPLEPVFPDGDIPFEEKFLLPPLELPSIGGAWSAFSVDMDGDGKLDLLVAGNGHSFIYLNKGTGNSIVFEKAWEQAADQNSRGTGAITAGDINADGKPDLLVNAPTLKLLINTSTGSNISFSAPVDILNVSCRKMTITDLDDDGRPEIIAATGYMSGGIKIFRNTGSPSSVSFELSAQIADDERYLLTDIDLDGKPDFVLRNGGSKDISVIRNSSTPGNISFANPFLLLLPGYPQDVVAGDVNADARKDLVIAIANSNTYCVIQNQSGTGALVFKSLVSYQAKKELRNIQLADLNGDGKADIILSYRDFSEISIVKNTTPFTSGPALSPEFGEPADYPAGDYHGFYDGDLLVADWNNDNFFDLSLLTVEGQIVVFRNNLFRPLITSFSPAQVTPGTTVTIKGYNFRNATAVHFGGQPAASFTAISPTEIQAVVGEGFEGPVSVTNPWLTNEKGIITFPKPEITAFAPASGPAGTEVIITGSNFNTNPSSNTVYFGAVRAEVLSASVTSLRVRVPISASYQLLSVTTFGVTAWSTKPFNLTYSAIGNGFTASTLGDKSDHLVNSVSNISGVSSADLNNDGLPDLAVTDIMSKTLSVLINTSDIGLVKFDAALIFDNVTDPQNAFTGDLDGDGKQDIAVANTVTGAITLFRNTSTVNNVSFSRLPPFEISNNVKKITGADLDGDGKMDLVMYDGDFRKVTILHNTSKGKNISFVKSQISGPSPNVLDVKIADLDGDRKPELLMTTYYGSHVSVYKNTSSAANITFELNTSLNLANNPSFMVAGDLDGDNKNDIAVIAGKNLLFFRNTSIGGTISFAAAGSQAAPSASSWELLLTDLDGDGKPDIVGGSGGVSTTKVMAFRNTSSTGISFDAGAEYHSNFECYDLTIADMDGDGREDIITAYPGGSREPGAVTILRNKIGEPRIAPNGSNPVTGNVITKLYVDPSVQSLNGQPFVQRHMDIIPVNNPQSATATITLFFTQQEFNNFNAAANHGPDLPKNPDDATGKSNLRIYQYHGTSDSGMPGTYSGNGLEIDPADADIVWNSVQQYWEVSFSVTGFSGFFVSSRGFLFNQTPAPVISADFASFCQDGKVLLKSSAEKNNQWYKDGAIINSATGKSYEASASGNYSVTTSNNGIVSPLSQVFRVTAGETPSKPFISRSGVVLISSSATGNQWFRDGALIPGSTGREITPANGSNYTVQATINGCVSPMSDGYYFVVTGIIDIDDQQYIRLLPNPVKTVARLEFKLNNIALVDIQITDMNGRTVLLLTKQSSGSIINLTHLPKGVYAARITRGNKNAAFTMKILKQ